MILALDQGTTGSKALLIDDDGKIVASRYREFTQHFPQPGWVEHDANEIWEVTIAVAHEALESANLRGPDVSGHRDHQPARDGRRWDRATGEPVTRAIVWQDRRTTDRCPHCRGGLRPSACAP